MGRDKALLPHGETTLLAHVAGLVTRECGSAIVVAAAPDQYPGLGAQVVGDLFPGAGPLGGIVTGLAAAGEGCHAVVACDMPYVLPELLRLLLECVAGHDAAIPMAAGRAEPLCAAYNAHCARALRASLEGGCRAVHAALRGLDVRWLGEDEIRVVDPLMVSLTNVNTPQDYALLAAAVRGRPDVA
jgi:molybdenum cofactor guanylyltransferase